MPLDGLVGHLKDFCLNLKSHGKPLKCVKWGVAGAIYIFKRSFWPLSRDPGLGEHRAEAGRPAKRITVGSLPVKGTGGLPGQGVQECEKGVGYSERVMLGSGLGGGARGGLLAPILPDASWMQEMGLETRCGGPGTAWRHQV